MDENKHDEELAEAAAQNVKSEEEPQAEA